MIKKNNNSTSYKIFKWVIRVIIVQLILINISAAFHAHRITHYYDDDRVRNMRSSSGTIFLRTWRLMVGRKFPKSKINYYPPFVYDTVLLKTKKGLSIEAWYGKADSAKGTVILFHGLNANKGEHISEALYFLGSGYNIMLVDLRAHGNSDGTANSIGVKEGEEVLLAYNYIVSKGESNIVLWGMSLGAVIITKAIYDHAITPSKIILEMPFDRLQDHLKARARVLGFPDEPFGFFVTFWTGVEQGYWGYSHKTSKYVRRVNMPVLLQWGAEDEYVMRSETEKIFRNIGSKDKQLVIYENARHERLLGRDEIKWKKSVDDFLGK